MWGCDRYLTQPTANEPLAGQVRRSCERLQQTGTYQDWQIRQAEQALGIYFVNDLQRTDRRRQPRSSLVDEHGRTNPPAALDELRLRIRTRHHSCRTGCSYADWVRRFFRYLGERQQMPHPGVDSAAVRDYPTDLAPERFGRAEGGQSRRARGQDPQAVRSPPRSPLDMLTPGNAEAQPSRR